MAQYLPLPDGTSVTIREGETPAQAWARAQQMYPEAFGAAAPQAGPGPESGFTPALKAGYSELKSGLAALAGKTGIMDPAAASQYIKEQEEYQQRTFKPTATFGEAPLTKTAELFGGSLPYMAAPLLAGTAVAAAPLTGTAATLAGLGAAGAASATQFTGSNIRRQMEEGKTLEEASLGSAALAALPQAALDTLSLKMMPGIRGIFSAAGKEVSAPVAKRIAEQGLSQVAKDYALATGKTMGIEGTTEAAQQVFERLQAGLNITDEKAREEYFDNFLGGAVMGGVLAPGGRYLERRGEAKQQEGERLAKAFEERQAQQAELAKQAQFRASPEGALQFVEDYEARQARFKELQAFKKPGADATPLERAEFDDVKKERNALNKSLFQDSSDYKKAKVQAEALLEQRRLAQMAPEDIMLEHIGVAKPKAVSAQGAAAPVKMRTVIDEMGRITEVPEGYEAAPEPDAAQQYLAGQVQAAKDVGQLSLADYADYAMQDPKLAKQAVDNRVRVPGLSATDNNTLLAGINLRLKEIDKQRAAETRAVMEQRAADLRAQQPTPETENQLAEIERHLAETAEKGPSYVEPTFEYLDPLFEKALGGNEVIKVSDTVRPTARAESTRARIEALMQEADKADQEYKTARAARQPDAALAARKRGTDALAAIESMSTEGNDYAKEVLAARKAQNEALAKLQDVTEQLRTEQTLSGANKAMAASTEQTLRKQAADMRAQLITNTLQEAALHRRAAGKPSITQDEAIAAASKLFDTINAWTDRAATRPEAVPTIKDAFKPIRERVNKNGATVRTYELYDPEVNDTVALTIVRRKDGSVFRVFSRYKSGGGVEFDASYGKGVTDKDIIQKGFLNTEMFTLGKEVDPRTLPISPAETAHFKARIDAIRRQLGEEAKVTPTRVETGILKRQFPETEAKRVAEERGETAATLGGELRRRTEYVRGKMAKMGAMRPAARDALNAAADIMDAGQATRELLDTVEPVVDAIVAGRQVKQIDIQAINDAIAATQPTAEEQRAAGQKQLGLEFEAPGEKPRAISEDLGYIRATPANFAKSPRIKPVWEAIAKARALAKTLAEKLSVRKARDAGMMKLVEKLQANIDNLQKDTQFFWKDANRWSDKEIAKAFVPYPEIGQTAEERELIDRFLTKHDLTPQEQARVDALIANFRNKHLPEYQTKINEAMRLLGQGQRLEAIDNQLLEHMQSSNEQVKKAAKALSDRIAPMRTTVEHLRKSMLGSPVLTEAQKVLVEADGKVKRQREDFQRAVERAVMKARAEMNSALAEILDPEIKRTQAELEKAKKTLADEQAKLDKIQKQFESILTQEAGANRTELATYELFRYEEKNSIIADLKAQIEEQEKDLQNLLETRFDELSGADVVARAMLDKSVKLERDYLEMLESQLADLRKENILDKPGQYPFAERRIRANIEAQKALVKDTESRVTEQKQALSDAKEKVKTQWTGMRFTQQGSKVVVPTDEKAYDAAVAKAQADIERTEKKIAEAKKAKNKRVQKMLEADLAGYETALSVLKDNNPRTERLRQAALNASLRAEQAAKDAAAKQAELDRIDAETAALVTELGAYEEFPNELAALKRMAEDETLSQEERDTALAKLGVLQNIEALEAQREVLLEGKPQRKQRAATAPSTSAMAKQKPLRTGYAKALSAASEGLRSEREQGVYGEAGEERPDLRSLFRTTGVGKGMDSDLVQSTVDDIRKEWKRVPPIIVVQNETGLPTRIHDQMIDEDMVGKAPGLYDPQSGNVYLIADNLRNVNDVALTIAHEVAGHFGLREMLGGTYAKTMQDIYDGNEAVRTAADGKMDVNPALTREVAVEEVLADMAETGPYAKSAFANAMRRIIYAIKQWLQDKLGIKHVTDSEVMQLVANARRFVKTGKGARVGNIDTSGVLYRAKPAYAADMGTIGDDIGKVVSQQKSWVQKVKANTTGLAFETQLVDRFAGFERLAKYMEPLKGAQMMYYLRMYDQRMNFVSQAVSNGAPQVVEKTRADGKKEYVIESTEGASIANVVRTLADAQKYVGNAEAVNQLFTTYLAALRADRVGLDALNFGDNVTQAMLDRARSIVETNKPLLDVFTRARNEYNAYNRNMINFVASTGAISQETADRLSRTNDYIPFYREQNGVAQLVIGGEAPIRIGSIAEQPYLHELVGGDQAILDFMTSSVQNTNMLTDMALRNLATKNAVFELVDLGAAKLVKHAEGRDVVKFKVDGKDKYAVMSTERVKIGNQEFDTGVPADLLVKGMEGIPTQMPALLRALAMPSQLLRKAVTLSPLYMAKQLFRDSLAAPLLSGADFTPVIGALRQIGSPTKGVLERRGIVGGQMLQGTTEDMTKILRDLADGKPGWQVALGKLEAMGMEADALTRRAQYNSYIEQGMSEMEATLMALESMNFNKRGASPSIHMANAMIPFFNAQIQGLNVLYKAMWGKMPANDKLKIRQKLLQRGAMMAAATLVYAAMMEDDEAYKNATPDQKYGNWFIRIPGVDEPVRLPVPFEIGYIFKALPEALYNSMTSEHGGEEAVKAFRQILLQTIPGGSSYGIPQALKPAIEAGLGQSFYTGRAILSAREKDLLPEEQFRANTSELAKAFGKALGFPPVMFEYLVRGYTGTVGLAFLHALSVGMPKSDSPEAAAKRLSDYPVVGGAFQPNDAGGIINNVYERMNEDIKVRDTYKKMLTEGRTAAANELLQRRGNEIMEAELGDHFKNTMNKLTQAERAVQASNMSPEDKRKQLDELRKLKTAYANTARTVGDKLVSVH